MNYECKECGKMQTVKSIDDAVRLEKLCMDCNYKKYDVSSSKAKLKAKVERELSCNFCNEKFTSETIKKYCCESCRKKGANKSRGMRKVNKTHSAIFTAKTWVFGEGRGR